MSRIIELNTVLTQGELMPYRVRNAPRHLRALCVLVGPAFPNQTRVAPAWRVRFALVLRRPASQATGPGRAETRQHCLITP